MAKLNPTNMKLEFREHGDACISCEVDGYRYHVWLDSATLEPVSGTLFKNPPLNAPTFEFKRRGRTQHLSIESGFGTKLWPLIRDAIKPLEPAARQALEDEIAKRHADAAAQRARNMAREAGPELLHALELLYDTAPDSAQYLYARSKAAAAIAMAKGS